MACRGVHFALTDDDRAKLLIATRDDDVLSVVQKEIEERWDTDWLCETDKAWDAIHLYWFSVTLSLDVRLAS